METGRRKFLDVSRPRPNARARLKRGVKRAYSLCLRLYPNPFRQTYALEMAEVFSDQVEEAAREGARPLLHLAGREGWHTAAAILRAYWLGRDRFFTALWGWMTMLLKALFHPEPPGAPDGRHSWPQAGLEVALFVWSGAALIASTYLSDPAWRRLADPLAAPVLAFPCLWLLVGLKRGLPRWAYPALGFCLGSYVSAGLASNALYLFLLLLLAALGLLGWAYLADRRWPFLPEEFRRWGQSLSADPTRLSFGLYGLLSLGIKVAYDNAYANNRTAWLLVSVLAMIGGAIAYSRSRKPLLQLAALTTGVTLALLAALLDYSHFRAIHWPGPDWVASLWLDLILLILAPPLASRGWNFLHQRRTRASQGD